MAKGGEEVQRIESLPNLDPNSQRFLRQMRGQGLAAAQTALGGSLASPFADAGGTSVFGGQPRGPSMPTGGGGMGGGGAGGGQLFSRAPSGGFGGGVSPFDGTLPLGPGRIPGAGGGSTPTLPNVPQGSFFAGPETRSIAELTNPFLNPFTQQVTDATRREFDVLRGQASRSSDQAATEAGAFGGSRQAVLEGTRLGELDRAQASQIANLNRQGFQTALSAGLPFAAQQRSAMQQLLQEPLFRQGQALNFLGAGLGPTAFGTSEQIFQPGNPGAGFLGGASTGAGIGTMIAPGIGTAIGAGAGGLLGLFS